MIPLDDQGDWFRYHHLFQAILQNELNRRFSADEIAIMHCRASDWFARNGLLEEAVHHALAAQNLDLAAQLVEEQRIDLLGQQQWLRIQNLLKLFPQDFLGQCVSLLSLKALVFCYSYNFDALLPTLKQVEYLLTRTDHKMSDQLRMVVESELALMWGFIYFWSADGARSLEKLNQAVEIVPTNHTFVYGHAVQFQILVYQMVGRYREALELAERAHGNVAKNGQYYLARIQKIGRAHV